MPFNINSFKTNISDFGVLPTNKFELYIAPPSVLLNNTIVESGRGVSTKDTIELLKFRSETLNAPGIALETLPVRRYGVGTPQKYPVNARFSDMSVSIICDRYGDLWQFWYNWIRIVWQFSGVEDGTTGGFSSRFATYNAEYKDEYSTTMQVLIYDQFGEVQTTINLYEAYPITFKETIFAWDNDNELLKLNIDITYKDYTLVGSTVDNRIQQDSASRASSINNQTNLSASDISAAIRKRITTP